jgi:hypothetical protein
VSLIAIPERLGVAARPGVNIHIYISTTRCHQAVVEGIHENQSHTGFGSIGLFLLRAVKYAQLHGIT